MTTIEGGALSLPGEAEVEAVYLQRFHGIRKDANGDMDVVLPGGKYNLTDIAACVGIGQLKQLDAFNAKRKALAAHYFKHMQTDPPLLLPREDDGHSWHMFAPLLPLDKLRISRKQFIQMMHEQGIGVGIHYPAMHLFSLYRKLGYQEGDFPNTERIGRETVTLPLFPGMALADVERVCQAVGDILVESRS